MPATNSASIVIVEDDPDIRELLEYNLQKEGYETTCYSDGIGVVEKLTLGPRVPDLILLDLMLPGESGLNICQQIRATEKLKFTPILMVTARGEESDIVQGLEKGADDYVVKPFSPRELLARVKSQLRRSKITSNSDSGKKTIQFGPIELELETFELILDGKRLSLTLAEFKLLRTLLSEPEKIFTRGKLVHSIAGEGTYIVERNVDVHIRALRKKLGERSSMIETARGVGYSVRMPEAN
jgi:DNA-binding response OmpR family regulator